MKILKKDIKHGIVSVLTQNIDDLWYLSHIIDKTDLVKGKTTRKIKLGDSDKNAKVIKKTVTLEIETEKVEFQPDSQVLRISGIITQGIEDIPSGVHHSFSIQLNDSISIIKKQWLKFQLEKLDESTKELSKVLLLALDRESAAFALLKKYGYELLSETTGDVQKKDMEESTKTNFFADTAAKLKDYIERYSIERVIIASPGFWKQEFSKVLTDEIKKIATFATCSTSGKAGIDELLKREEVKTVLAQDRTTKEIAAVEELLANISKDEGLASYGLQETENAINAGAVQNLLVTDDYLFQQKENNNYEQIDALMKTAESTQANIMIISSKHEGGTKLDGLGGIAAVLRYRIE